MSSSGRLLSTERGAQGWAVTASCAIVTSDSTATADINGRPRRKRPGCWCPPPRESVRVHGYASVDSRSSASGQRRRGRHTLETHRGRSRGAGPRLEGCGNGDHVCEWALQEAASTVKPALIQERLRVTRRVVICVIVIAAQEPGPGDPWAWYGNGDPTGELAQHRTHGIA